MANNFAKDASREDITEAVKRDGYAIIENVIGEEELNQLRAELAPCGCDRSWHRGFLGTSHQALWCAHRQIRNVPTNAGQSGRLEHG